MILCPLYEVLLPGLDTSSSINSLGNKEFLIYVTPKGEKQTTVIQSIGNGKALIEKMDFDCCEIKDVEIDFEKNLCSFYSQAKLDENIPLLLKNILSSFWIQYPSKTMPPLTPARPPKNP